MTFVNGYCSIKNRRIVKDHRVILEDSDADRNSFLNHCYSQFNSEYPKFYKMNPLSQLGVIATEVLLKGRVLTKEYSPHEIAVVLSNATSSLETDIRYFETTKEISSPSLFVYTLPNIVAGEICIRNQFKGENAFFIFEQFDPVFLSQYVNTILGNESARSCIAGWVEVLGEDYEAFLYLVEKQKNEIGIEHTAENLLKLYISE